MIKQMKMFIFMLLSLGLIAAFSSCSDYVSGIQDPINDAGDDNLNDVSDIPFLIKGVQTAWSIAFDEHTVFADGMSDQLGFTRDISQATYPTFEQLDNAWREGQGGLNPLIPDNNSTESIMLELGQLRLYADTLIERVTNRISFTDSEEDQALKKAALFTGYFYGAIARYMWGAYWGLHPDDGGGGVINKSAYIPRNQMFDDAIAKLNLALAQASDEYEAKMVNTLKARILVYQEKYQDAATAVVNALAPGDDSFSALYNTVLNNYWYYWSGIGRSQWHVAPKMHDYVVENPQEAARIPLYKLAANLVYSDSTYYQQLKYNQLGSPIRFLSWQEANLIKAELAIRAGENPTAMGLINEVRANYGIDPVTDEYVTDKFGGNYLELLIVERDKEFAFEGMRLNDQRHFKKWHLDPAKTWQYFPIGKNELDANPNLK